MQQMTYTLDMFEGPLDLLLHLIAKHKLDIQNIEITILLTQYLDYIGQMKRANMEIAASFLAMAARLRQFVLPPQKNTIFNASFHAI